MSTVKHTISAMLISAFAALSLYAGEETPDTLLMFDSPSKVVISESSEGTFINVSGLEGGETREVRVGYSPESKVTASQSTVRKIFRLPGVDNRCGSRRSSWTVSVDGLCIGLTDASGQTGGGGLQWSRSFEISWLSCLNVNYDFSRSSISLGLGFDWRNYRCTLPGQYLVPLEGGKVGWAEVPDDMSLRFSRLKVFSLQLPLLYAWNLPKSELSVKLGAIPCFNTHASLKGSYDDADGNRCEYYTKAVDRRRFTVDFFWSLSYSRAVGVYVRYSPMKVLKDGSPVNFNPLTVGIGFFI